MKQNNMNLAGMDLLLVEDDPLLRRQMAVTLEQLGGEVFVAVDLKTARELRRQMDFDIVLLDMNLPDGLGMDLLREELFAPSTGVVIMTANSNVQHAVEAMRLGALDYLVKPFNPLELPLVLARAQRARQSNRREDHRRTEAGQEAFQFGDALGDLKSRLDKIIAADQRIAGTPPPVLIEGETGTGKTTIARWIHHHGARSGNALVEVNCSALPEALAEAELFGHERGAFTDAHAARMGLFEAAHEGTLFLDELPSLSLALQAKVLTAIEDQMIRRVGARKPIAMDVRIIAATSQDLKQLAASGAFREDLYHRLDLYRLRLPPLRERGQDILRLAEDLLGRLYRKHRQVARRISRAGQERLLTYPWPGNVRELAHELERALVFEEGGELDFRQLLVNVPGSGKEGDGNQDWFNERFLFPDQGFHIEKAVLRMIRHALKQSRDNMAGAARLLGVPRDYLRYRLEKPVEEQGSGTERPGRCDPEQQ
jgi:DNA-binding NtrC family response regulator